MQNSVDDTMADTMAAADDDWVDLQKATARKPAAPRCSLSLSYYGRGSTQHSAARRAAAMLVFRDDLAVWLSDHGPHYAVQIGGARCNLIRIIPSPLGGFRASPHRGVWVMRIGHVNLWPNEFRPAIAVSAAIEPGRLLLTLPADFASPRRAPMRAESKAR